MSAGLATLPARDLAGDVDDVRDDALGDEPRTVVDQDCRSAVVGEQRLCGIAMRGRRCRRHHHRFAVPSSRTACRSPRRGVGPARDRTSPSSNPTRPATPRSALPPSDAATVDSHALCRNVVGQGVGVLWEMRAGPHPDDARQSCRLERASAAPRACCPRKHTSRVRSSLP